MTSAVECDYSQTGSGPPLFLIHGIGANRDAWRLLLPKLVREFTVISYDLRGHGNSANGKSRFNLDDLVNDLEWVRARSGFQYAHFAGHSLGGMIAPAYARAFPDHVTSLALISTAAGRSLESRLKLQQLLAAMRNSSVREQLPALEQRWFTEHFMSTQTELVAARKQQVLATDSEVFLNAFDLYATTEMIDWLPEIHVPALVITGALDAGCSPHLNRGIAEALPQAVLKIIPGYKHALLLEAPEILADQLINFFKATVRTSAMHSNDAEKSP